ncbi:Calcium-binding EF hand family protein [Abeliophyllum distichum]|uniref:Calcium-binding EF hand family protein n=1 Tax=Abeliophyllum distichum TaxID=126358 RepID=A0ABD1SF74_9LAMI
MSKAVVVCTILATAFILLILLSENIKYSRKYYGPHGLNRRLGIKTPIPVFDPLVAEMERMGEEKEGKRKGLEKDKNYFYDDGRLNISLRLMILFPLLDREPRDGFVDAKELEAWIVHQAFDRMHYRTKKELESHDEDGDGYISFSEHFPLISKEDIETNDMKHGEAGWWMEQFRNADADRNGTLNVFEFQDFLHPEDSRNDQIQRWLLRDKIRQMDYDNDQKLNLEEFEAGAYDSYKTCIEFETGWDKYHSPEELFNKLDIDKDKFLRVEELKPMIQYLNPGELTYAKYYSSYLMHEADDNQDGKLTLDEMLNHDSMFYNTVYDNGRFDDEDDDFHDEL